MTAAPGPEPTFDLDLYLSLPRVAGLVLAPDGGRLVTSVATPGPDGKKLTSAELNALTAFLQAQRQTN